MIEPKHISSVQISFVNASSKEGPEFFPGDIEVTYYEGEKRVTRSIMDDQLIGDFISNLINKHLNEQG